MATDLAAVLIGPLLIVELQLFGGNAVVVVCLFSCGLTQQLERIHNSD